MTQAESSEPQPQPEPQAQPLPHPVTPISGEWFFSLDNEQRGPVGIEDIRYMLHAGTLQPASLVWTAGMPQWQAAAVAPEFSDVIATVVGDPRSLQYGHTQSYYAAAAGIQYATFWQRLCAGFIDGLVTGVAANVLALMITVVLRNGAAFRHAGQTEQGLKLALGQCLGWLYFAFMATSPKQGTLGMMAMGLKVTDLQGRPITFARATGRHFAILISDCTCLIGFLMILWTERRQTLHDMIAGTLIVKPSPPR